jgi:hypothetical protein
MNAVDFLYERLGQYIAPGEDRMAWALSAVLSNKDGKKVSFRGPAIPTVLASESGVWVQTNFLPPPDLPAHIHWGVDQVFGMAVKRASELGVWYGIRFSAVGPEKFVSQHSVNMPGSDVFVFRLDSGRKSVSWKPVLVNELIALVGSAFPVTDSKTVFALADYAAGGKWRGRALNRDQERVARTVYNLLAKEQPDALLPDGRRGLRAAIDAIANGEGSIEKGEIDA